MQSNRYRIGEKVYLTGIKTDKFKTGRISLTMFLPISKPDFIPNILLPQLLTRSCSKYNDYISFNRSLNELYGASLSSYARKVGDSIGITVSIAGLDDRFLMDGDEISGDLTSMLCEIVFHPKIEGNAFAKEDFEQEQRELLETIYAEINEKRTYAVNKCIDEMCKNELFGISRQNCIEQLESVTPEDVYGAWQNALKRAKIEITVVGMFDVDKVERVFKDELANIERKPCKLSSRVISRVEKSKELSEDDDVNQAKLVMGFRTPIAVPDKRSMAMRLAVAMLGGVQSSKLFMNVREKLSLCYYCAARYLKNKGIVLIDSGVEHENIEQTKLEILNQIKLMQEGDITDEELEYAKLAIINSFRSSADTVSGMEYWFTSQMLDGGLLSVEQACEKINQVTKDEIVKAMQTLSLDTVFVLKNGKEL